MGEDHVGRAKLLDTHNNAENFKMERFVVPEGSKSKAKSQRAKVKATLRRFRPPMPINMQREGERLTWFAFGGKHYAVQQAYGPWRKSGEWWSADLWSREEWDVHAKCSPDEIVNCVISHDLLHHNWQLEGLYD